MVTSASSCHPCMDFCAPLVEAESDFEVYVHRARYLLVGNMVFLQGTEVDRTFRDPVKRAVLFSKEAASVEESILELFSQVDFWCGGRMVISSAVSEGTLVGHPDVGRIALQAVCMYHLYLCSLDYVTACGNLQVIDFDLDRLENL
jgi:hypothetical protein